MPSADMEKFKATFLGSKHIIAVAGAGLSVASGLIYIKLEKQSVLTNPSTMDRYTDLQRCRWLMEEL